MSIEFTPPTSFKEQLDEAVLFPRRVALGSFHTIKNTSIGIGSTALSLLTLGKVPKLNDYADNTGFADGLINFTLFLHLMKVINSNFRYKDENSNIGIATRLFAKPFFDRGIGSITKKNILTRHVVARAAFLTGVLLAVTTRTVDVALGIFAACASIITIGAIPKINTFAVQHLKATSIIHDICGGLRGIVNPFQYIRLPKETEY